jgi:hypothetical protein
MGEISNNLMSSMIKQKNKMAFKKKREKLLSAIENDTKSENFDTHSKKADIHNSISKHKYGGTFSATKLNNIISNLIKIDTNKENISKEENSKHSKITKEKDLDLSLLKNKKDNSKKNYINIFKKQLGANKKFLALSVNKESKSKNNSIIDNSNNIFSNNIPPRPFSQRKALKRNFSSEVLDIKKLNKKRMLRPSTGKESHIYPIKFMPHNININRNNLYAKKLFSRLNCNSAIKRSTVFPSLKEKLSEAGEKINSLNFNVKEKTEQLVKSQFYLNSYKNCCKILPNNSLSTNTSIILNYKNMWNNVKSYTNSIISKNSIPESGFATKRKKMGRSRSVSSLIRKQ